MSIKNGYGFGEIIQNALSLIYTKVFYRNARLVRRPIYVRGRKLLQYEKGFTTGYNCRLEMFNIEGNTMKKLVIGENCKIGDYVHIAAGEKVIIGNNCLLASHIYISDINHGDYSGEFEFSSPAVPPDKRPLYTNPITIGDNVWVGENVCILPGVKIGDGCVIGANSVVNKNINANCMVAGAPAKIIKVWDAESKLWKRYYGD